MPSDDFFRLVRAWLTVYLPRSRRLSPHTIRSYKTTLATLLTYLRETRGLDLTSVSFEAIDHATIRGFTKWLMDSRHVSPASANQRLAAIKSFLAFCAAEDPALVAVWLDIKQGQDRGDDHRRRGGQSAAQHRETAERRTVFTGEFPDHGFLWRHLCR